MKRKWVHLCAHLEQSRAHHRQLRNISCWYCPQGDVPEIPELWLSDKVFLNSSSSFLPLYIQSKTQRRSADVIRARLWCCYGLLSYNQDSQIHSVERNTAHTPLHPKSSTKCQAKYYRIPLASFVTFLQGGLNFHHA